MENPLADPSQASNPTVVTDSEDDGWSDRSRHSRRGSFTDAELWSVEDRLRRLRELEREMEGETAVERDRFRGNISRDFRSGDLELRASRPIVSGRWQYVRSPLPPNDNPVALPPMDNDLPRPPSKPPSSHYRAPPQNPQQSRTRRPSYIKSQREQRWWDDYNKDPNISGQRWGELERAKTDPRKAASNQFPEQSTSQREKARDNRNRRQLSRSPDPSPPPRSEPYSRNPYYHETSSNPRMNRKGPQPDEYPMYPPNHGYRFTPTRSTPLPRTYPQESYGPPRNLDHPFADRFNASSYPQPYPEYQQPDPYFSATDPTRQRSYYPGVNDHQEYPRFRPESFPTPFNGIHNKAQRPASKGSWESQSDEESYLSSSDEDDAVPKPPDEVSTDETSSTQSPVRETASGFEMLNIDTNVDEDLLDPTVWARKASAIETIIRKNHKYRNLWLATWRHSDSKTCPKVMRGIWTDICEVDESITRFDLDAITLPAFGSTYDSKAKGSLNELLEAFESRPLPESVGESSRPKQVPCLPSDPYQADNARHEILRLLKARDYLILVSRDAEYLNELHSSMDAISWFQQMPPISSTLKRSSRPRIIELKSVTLTQLTEIVFCLNFVLKIILWGLKHHSSICFDTYEGTTEARNRTRIPLGFGLLSLFDPMESKIHNSEATRSGVKVISDYMNEFGMGLAAFIDEMEKLSAILSGALNVQCDVHIAAGSEPEMVTPLFYGITHIAEFQWSLCELGCMSELIQGRRVWVLNQVNTGSTAKNFENSGKAHIKTKITDLARIWGPIWRVSKPSDDSCIWYRLPSGYLGHTESRISSQVDETPCHFSKHPRDFDSRPSARYRMPTTPYLLIGQDLPSGLKQRVSCQMHLEKGLQGFALQTVGTLAPHKYIDSMTGQLGLGQWGLSANWSTQIKTNPGILAKESYLQRWKLEPEFRNPRMLLLWYGVELSLCTRNARRCRVIDLLRSHVIIQYLETMYKPQASLASFMPTLLAALKSTNPDDFLILYDAHPEWRREIGTVVVRCLDLLKDTGVNYLGDLVAFAFLEELDDSEQLAVIPKATCTWIGLLKDTFDMATFAVVSPSCLEFRGAPGQRCRRKGQNCKSKSVLETSYVPAERLSVQKLFQSMHPNDRLKMKATGKFKIKQRASKGVILLGTWDSLRYKLLPSTFRELFQEKRQEKEQAIKVFVVSKRTQALIHRKKKRKTKSEPGEEGGKWKQPHASDNEEDSNQSQAPTASSTKHTFSSNDTRPSTKVSSQATPSKSSLQSSGAGSAKSTENPQSRASSTAYESAPKINGNSTTQVQKPKLADKGVQANLPLERPIIQQEPSDEEDQAPADPEPASRPSRPKEKQKQRANDDEGPVVHQGSSNPALLSPDVDAFTNSSRERERRHRRRSSKTRQRERSDADSPPRSSHRRQRSDASGGRPSERRSGKSVEDTGGSVRASIAKSFGLGYNK